MEALILEFEEIGVVYNDYVEALCGGPSNCNCN